MESFALPISALPMPLKHQALLDALNTSQPNPKGGPSKEFEMMFNKIMHPEKYKKKYGHLEKQTKMPPSYLLKKPKKQSAKERALLEGSDLNEMMMPLSMYA